MKSLSMPLILLKNHKGKKAELHHVSSTTCVCIGKIEHLFATTF